MLKYMLGEGGDPVGDVLKEVKKYVNAGVLIILSLCAAVVVFYAIYLGIRMAKAEDEGARKDAKGHLLYAIIGVIVIALVAVIVGAVLPSFTPEVKVDGIGEDEIPGLSKTLEVINTTITVIMELITTAAVIFAVYVGWKFISAETDDKRKNAKMQLLYTVLGIIGVMVLMVVAQAVLTAITPTSE